MLYLLTNYPCYSCATVRLAAHTAQRSQIKLDDCSVDSGGWEVTGAAQLLWPARTHVRRVGGHLSNKLATTA